MKPNMNADGPSNETVNMNADGPSNETLNMNADGPSDKTGPLDVADSPGAGYLKKAKPMDSADSSDKAGSSEEAGPKDIAEPLGAANLLVDVAGPPEDSALRLRQGDLSDRLL